MIVEAISIMSVALLTIGLYLFSHYRQMARLR